MSDTVDLAAPVETPSEPAADHRTLRIALVGVPNAGKTALFNALTGARQKVANYAGVTVERKEGSAHAPSGARLSILDLPGTYSLRARSPDEVVTRDAVLGRLAGEARPDVMVCVADATNLRVAVRLALELKAVGRPMLLALNMHDIALRQGIDIDLAKLSEALGMPVVPTVATRKRGIDVLLAEIDRLGALGGEAVDSSWHEPGVGEVRAGHAAANKIVKFATRPPTRPDTWTGKLDNVLLHPLWGSLILSTLLFLMFQAVFAWATPVMDLITAGFDALGAFVKTTLPSGMLRSLIADGIISGVGSVLVFLPQIVVLFAFIILLEDVGYMARAAFLMDKIMGGAGLHGRAFIPLLSSFACAIPGIMAARVIDSRRDRLATIMVAPLMTCSARIPVYTLIISAFV
ncbi:MAG: ferrous iron transporter B, partial [Caulobacteraceae bacterium]